ncbi:MAG: four helix bundle protein [Bacteroidota bacterium]
MYGFEKLDTWKRSKSLSILIYSITNDFPNVEKFGLISQMRRSAVSVQSNIAEGSARMTNKDRSHFYTVSYSSLMELLNQLILSYELGFCTEALYNQARAEVSLVAKLLNGLRKSER